MGLPSFVMRSDASCSFAGSSIQPFSSDHQPPTNNNNPDLHLPSTSFIMATSTASALSNIAAARAAEVNSAVEKTMSYQKGVVPAHGAIHPPVEVDRMLPTPPNSISPTLPPRGSSNPFHRQTPLDSDMELDHVALRNKRKGPDPLPLSQSALSDLDKDGGITPALLAKHYLPDLLLEQGPIAIRHVLNHLAQTVPGFASLGSAKARRTVVSALETSAGGSHKGCVQFVKVGWGRWDAHVDGQPVGTRRNGPLGGSPDVDAKAGRALKIPRGRQGVSDGHDSWTGGSISSSRAEGVHHPDMAEHEADKMSLDDNIRGSCAQSLAASDETMFLDASSGDETEEEDWQAIGAERLCLESPYPPPDKIEIRDYNHLSKLATLHRNRYLKRRLRDNARSASPRHRRSQHSQHKHHHDKHDTQHLHSQADSSLDTRHTLPSSVSGVLGGNPDEREAVEALLRMGST